MDKLQIFSNEEFGDIRTVTIDGEPWFCLADVCRALELSNPADVKKRLNEKGIDTIDTLTAGGIQKLLYVNEANLYKTIFQSRKESAERFTDWVTSEVLPALRKTGTYTMPGKEHNAAVKVKQRELTTDDMIEAARIVSKCRNDRMPYVMNFLKQGGFSVPELENLKSADSEPEYDIPDLIKQVMREFGYTAEQIGDAAGLDRVQISRYRSGKTRPRAERADELRGVLLAIING